MSRNFPSVSAPKFFSAEGEVPPIPCACSRMGGYNLFSPLPEGNEDADAAETAAPAPQPAPKQPRRRSLFRCCAGPSPLGSHRSAAFYRNAERCDDDLLCWALWSLLVRGVLQAASWAARAPWPSLPRASPTAAADGLRVGDTILKVDGQVCRTIASDLIRAVLTAPPQTQADFTVLREWPASCSWTTWCYGRSFYRCRRQPPSLLISV